MERFEAVRALRLIEAHGVTHSQWVPTMFVRLLKLPAVVRAGYDLSSLRWAVHAAAPWGKTAAAADERGWRTVGDVGYLDRDGYLYLSDRASNLIISGGVNIYPQEIENVLTMHPDLLDAAVLGVPDQEMGEQVKAVVQVAGGVVEAGALAELADRLAAYCRSRLAGFKCPQSFEFTTGEVRTPVGKIRRGPLREQFGSAPGRYRPRFGGSS